MAFARALSRRSARPETTIDTKLTRMGTKKRIQMGEISLPVNLISTTNMLSYEAPDISALRDRGFSLASSPRSSSEETPSSPTSIEPALTEGSSAGSSPRHSPILEHNHLSAYFPASTLQRSKSTIDVPKVDLDVPPLPRRAPSHSKLEHERLAKSKSMHHVSRSPSGSLENTPKATQSEIFAACPLPPVSKATPFVQELDQLNECAEEYHFVAQSIEQEEDLAFMKLHGLAMLRPSTYVDLVSGGNPFEIGLPSENVGGWI